MNKNNPFIISCEKSSFLIEKKLGGVISMKERSQLFIHKLICTVCRSYEAKSMLLDHILRKKKSIDTFPIAETEDKNAINKLKLRILEKLK